MKNKEIKVVVHNGVFHADDVLCVALLKVIYKNPVKVYRTRKFDPKEYNFILDVGMEDHIGRDYIAFDHHQRNSKYYNNGVKYAACGKLAELLFTANYSKDYEKVLDKLREVLLYPVEAQDNGQNIPGLCSNKLAWVGDMNPDWESGSNGDKEFEDSVNIAEKILESILDRINAKLKAEVVVEGLLKENGNNKILILDKFIPWNESVINHNSGRNNKILYVVYPGKAQNWYIQAVPMQINRFGNIKDLPAEWAGKRDGELSRISGIPGAVFCHTAKFIAGWETKEEAIQAAQAAVLL